MNFHERAMKILETELSEIKDMPDELSGWAAVNDEFIAEMIASAVTNYVLRADEPLERVQEVMIVVQKIFLDPESVHQLMQGEARAPRLRESLLPESEKIKRERAMFLQWNELSNMDTAEGDEE